MSEEVIKIIKDEKEMFDFLNELRGSGSTNMWGASPYVSEQFEIEETKARKVLSKWMNNFNADGYEHLL